MGCLLPRRRGQQGRAHTHRSERRRSQCTLRSEESDGTKSDFSLLQGCRIGSSCAARAALRDRRTVQCNLRLFQQSVLDSVAKESQPAHQRQATMAVRGTCLNLAAGSRHAFALRGGTSLAYNRHSSAQYATPPNTEGELVACSGTMCTHMFAPVRCSSGCIISKHKFHDTHKIRHCTSERHEVHVYMRRQRSLSMGAG